MQNLTLSAADQKINILKSTCIIFLSAQLLSSRPKAVSSLISSLFLVGGASFSPNSGSPQRKTNKSRVSFLSYEWCTKLAYNKLPVRI